MRRLGPAGWIGTAFGIGLIPGAPGTYATLATAAVTLLLSARFTPALSLALTLAAAVASLAAYRGAARDLGGHDPRPFVMDEVAGFWAAMLGLGAEPVTVLLAAILFRFFDILKPPPIRQLDRMRGAWGVLLDDLAAGIAANVLLRAGYWIAAHWG